MKFHSASVLGLALATQSTSAWLPTTSQFGASLLSRTAASPNYKRLTSSLFSSAAAAAVPVEPDLAVSPRSALQATGQLKAEGNIISAFPGGLTAVRVSDDDVSVAPASKAASDSPSLKAEVKRTTSNSGDDMLGRQVLFSSGSVGVVVAERSPIVFCFTESDFSKKTDGVVQILSSMADVAVSDNLHCVDCFGRPLDIPFTTTTTTTTTTTSTNGGTNSRAMFAPIPKLKDIALINNPMLTGTTMVDALAPIGKGQNMLVIGHDVPQMRGFVRDFFATQQKEGRGTKCIYGITQNRDQVLDELRTAGLLDDVIVVSTRQDCQAVNDEASKAAEAVAVAASACAIGETFAFQGLDALVVIDTIDQHKNFWDSTTRVLVDAYGVDAVVESDRSGGASSEMRGFFSSLIQRSSQYNARLGGGSLTLTLLTSIPSLRAADESDDSNVYSVKDFAQCSDKIKTRLDMLVNKNIPLTAANLRKIQIPIPSASEGQRRLVLQHVDDLMSMSDGQIWLDELLEEQGQRPPLDPQKSVTRIGIGADTDSRADAPAIRKVVEGLRLDLSQAASMDGADVTTKATKKQALKRSAWLLAMHQEAGEGGRSLSESCIALLAAANGSLDGTIEKGGLAGTALGRTVVNNLLRHVQTVASDATAEIDQTLDMSSNARQALEKAIESYVKM